MSVASSTLAKPTTAPGAARLDLIYKLTVSVAIILSIVLAAGVYQLGSNAVLAGGFFGALFIYLASRPSRGQLTVFLASSLLIGTLYAMLGGRFGRDAGMETLSWWIGIGAFLGTGGIVAMSLDKVWAESEQFTVPLRDALIVPVFMIIGGLAMQFLNGGKHLSFDFLLYRFDSSLGLSPGHAVASLFHKLPWIKAGSLFAYTAILIFPPLYHGWALFKGKGTKIHLVYAFVVAGVAGSFVYQICPAMGPIYALGRQFPDHMPPGIAVPAKAFLTAGVFNAIPSLHMTWALLVWAAAWELGWFAVAAASLFVVFTGFATLGFGEHYLIDLVVSVPLVVMTRGICAARHRLIAAGLAAVIAWTVYLRTGSQLPASLNWLLVVTTVAVPAYFFMVRRCATKLS